MDLTFGMEGILTTTVESPGAGVFALTLDPNGKPVVAGTGANSLVVARFLTDSSTSGWCGNGIEESAEECDADASSGARECCDATCHVVDADSDGFCDRDDPCVGPAVVKAPKLRLRRLGGPSGDEELSLHGTMRLTSAPSYDLRAHGARLILRGTAHTVVDSIIPGGALAGSPAKGWIVKRTGARYVDRTSAPIDGIVKVAVRSKGRLITFDVRGEGAAYSVAPGTLPLTALIVLDPTVTIHGQCGEIAFGGPSTAASCAFNRAGTTLRCGGQRPRQVKRR